MQRILYIAIIMTNIILSFKTFSFDFNEGQQYIQLNQHIANKPHVIEFFSFCCLQCYYFDHVYHILNKVKKSLPADIKVVKYHVDYLKPMGKNLTQAWAVAIALGIEDKISPLLFNGLQKTQTIKTLNDIRNIFIQIGISAEEYNSYWNSLIVRSLVIQQEKAAIDFKLFGVPTIFINGKYMVKNDGFNASSVDDYTKQFVELVKFLLIQK